MIYEHNGHRQKLKKRLFPFIILVVGIALRWYGLDWGLSNAYTFHPDEMRLFYAVDKISWQPVFRMTRQVFQELVFINKPGAIGWQQEIQQTEAKHTDQCGNPESLI